jgi:hypothetical protein
MTFHKFAAVAIFSLIVASCASTSEQGASIGERAEPASEQIVGKPAPDSGFAKLSIGMDMQQTQDVMGHAPDRFHTYESGKRWIPFYFGTDARRMQVLYKGEGCLTFTGGNAWGGGGGELIQVENDPSGACYQP